jgi:hypothetical protein
MSQSEGHGSQRDDRTTEESNVASGSHASERIMDESERRYRLDGKYSTLFTSYLREVTVGWFQT